MRHLLLLALSFVLCAAGPAFDVVGVWEVQHTDGTPITFVVNEDGTATNDWQGGARGEWRWDGDRAVFDWEDGWRDVISREADGTFVKVAWGPGVDRAGEPSNRTPAVKKGASAPCEEDRGHGR